MRVLDIFAKPENLCGVDGTGKCDPNMDFWGFLTSFGSGVFSTLFIIAGIMSVIMIIVCGIIMMTSAGDPGKVAKAKKGLTGAIVGLIISLCAFAIATAISTTLSN